MKINCRWKALSITGCLVIHLCCIAQTAVAEIKPDYLMFSDPELQLPEPLREFDPKAAELWLQALNRPEIDMQRMAAETIARAHKSGFPDLNKAVPRLEEIVTAESSHPSARFAAAHALIVLDARDSADKLFEVSQNYGADLRQLIEPALAAWDNAAAKAVWTERLGSDDVGQRDLMLAIQGLGKVQEQAALPKLLEIAGNANRNAGVRIAAATAAGQIAETGLEEEAERLADSTNTPHYLNQFCALRLLARHSSDQAKKLLVHLADSKEPAVVGAAMQRLNEIDVAAVLPLAMTAIKSPDAKVRREGVVCLLQKAEVGHIPSLGQLLADPDPSLRRQVCDGLFELSKQPQLNGPVVDVAMQVLAGDLWQGQEQAALLLGALAHQPAANRFLELQDAPRDEVRIAAAWALRKVAVPETVPALIEQATRLTEFRKNKPSNALDQQAAHLFEALAVLQAEDATPLLRQYVPKHVQLNDLSRGAAIWALGRLNEGTKNEELATAFEERILDFQSPPSEALIVKQMSAISLGRMQAVDQAPMMQNFASSDDLKLGVSSLSDLTSNSIDTLRLRLALAWAVHVLTGEELPPPERPIMRQIDWFLEPTR